MVRRGLICLSMKVRPDYLGSRTRAARSFEAGREGFEPGSDSWILALLGWQRRAGDTRTRFFLFDFPRKPTNKTAGTPPP